jgi:hypothetical protein
MKLFMILISFLFCTSFASGQEKEQNIILGVGSGGGITHWQLQTSGSNFYDSGGPSVPIQLETFYSYQWLRVGMGISFEQLYIDSLNSSQTNRSVLTFRNRQIGFSKIFLQLEGYPIQNSKFNFGLMANIGIYHLDDQFSQEAVIKQMLFSAGIIGEYIVNSNIRLYMNPMFQFKYFEFSTVGIPLDAQNKIGSGLLILGFRYMVF